MRNGCGDLFENFTLYREKDPGRPSMDILVRS